MIPNTRIWVRGTENTVLTVQISRKSHKPISTNHSATYNYVDKPQHYVDKPQHYVDKLQCYVDKPQHHVDKLQCYVDKPQRYMLANYVDKPQCYVDKTTVLCSGILSAVFRNHKYRNAWTIKLLAYCSCIFFSSQHCRSHLEEHHTSAFFQLHLVPSQCYPVSQKIP